MSAPADQVGPAEAAPFEVTGLHDGAVFTIARPRKLNALTLPVLQGLAACIDRLEADGKRLLVITGAGERAFCAGTDLSEMQSMTMQAVLDKCAMARALLLRLSRSPLISVAAVNGLALGGGTELAMACTLRLAAPNAVFGLPEIKLGLLPAYGGTQFLPAIVGPARALELMLTGRDISVEEALVIGLADRVADGNDNLLATAIAYAREITQYNPAAIAAIRRCVAAAGSAVSDGALGEEDSAVRSIFPSADAIEGVARFLAGKKA